MRLVTESALRAGWFPSMVRSRHDLTVMVKGTFQLHQGGTAELVEPDEQLFFEGDLRLDPEAPSSLLYEADAAPFKPRADLLLVGNCHAPGGRPTPQCLVKLAVGFHERSLAVVGDRQWKKGLLRQSSEPQPFVTMPITYERAFGGSGFEANPIGRGAGKGAEVMPNIESPKNLVTSPKKSYPPASFGPLDRTWALRRSKLGTYDAAWLAKRWPRFPADFDWSYFNCAPPEQQVGYLNGDEELHLWNIHPEQEDFRCQLPGIRPRCFARTTAAEGGDLRDLNLNLDTLWVDAEAGRLVLLWRAVTAVHSWDYEELELLYLAEETVDSRPRSLMHYASALARLLSQAEVTEEEQLVLEEMEPTALWSEMSAKMKLDGLLDDKDEEPDSSVLHAPLFLAFEDTDSDDLDEPSLLDLPLYTDLAPDVDDLIPGEATILAPPPSFDDELPADEPPRLFGTRQIEAPTDEAPLLPTAPEEAAAEEQDEGEAELAEMVEEANQKVAQMAEGALPPEVRAAMDEDRADDLVAALLARSSMTPEEANKAVEDKLDEMRELLRENGQDPALVGDLRAPEPEPEPPPRGRLTRQDVEERLSEGTRSFAGEDLRGVDLRGLDLSGVDLSEAQLDGADLSEVSLAGAVLAEANLEQALLTEADLGQANLSGARLGGAALSGARLVEALLAGASLVSADLSGTDLTEAHLPGATLTDANLRGATLDEADLTGAVLTAADLRRASAAGTLFDGADLSRARLDQLSGQGASLRGATVTAASLRQAELIEADLSEARLDQVRFDGAKMSKATLTGAAGEEVSFEGADLTELRASGCRLPGARMSWVVAPGSQWVESVLTGASLRFADLSGAGFVGADLGGADLHAADLRLANLSKATLVKAVMIQADLFQARFERADLRLANLAGASCYQAEFLEAQVDQAVFDGANLGGSKLAHLGRRL